MTFAPRCPKCFTCPAAIAEWRKAVERSEPHDPETCGVLP